MLWLAYLGLTFDLVLVAMMVVNMGKAKDATGYFLSLGAAFLWAALAVVQIHNIIERMIENAV